MVYKPLSSYDATADRLNDRQDYGNARDLETNPEDHNNTQATGSETSSLVDNDCLTPGTLSPPSYNAGSSSPVVSNFPSTTAPIVCCRAGIRPVAPPPYQNETDISDRAAEDIESQPAWLPLEKETHNESDLNRLSRPSGWRRQSRHWVRGLITLAILLGLFLTHRSLSSQISDAFPPTGKHGVPCSSPHSSENIRFVFDEVEHFSFLEEINTSHDDHSPFRGTLRIEPAPADQTADIVVSVSYKAPGKRSLSYPPHEATASSLRIQAPSISWKHLGPIKSLGFRGKASATISLKPNINLTDFSISTATFGITTSPDLFARTNATIDSTTLTTPHNPITLPLWTNSRKTVIRTTSSAITGTFTLLDLLSLSSISGTISATVNPGEADPDDPHPAYFSASSHSGSVHVAFPRFASALPRREYRSSASSSSGTVTGSYILGDGASLSSHSGSIRAEVLAFSGGKMGRLITTAGSGSTDVTILDEGVEEEEEGAVGVKAWHKSASGSVRLRYPEAWEGRIEGRTGSGNVKVRGRGVVVDVADGVGGRFEAHKGDVDSNGRLEFDTGSGSVDVLIG